ncbi:MAG: TetR/AcrR family transcriptional regulator [Aggregatilineales bacterium]
MSKANETKARLIETTADLITRQGYHATGLNQITQDSGIAMGSLYYHFKGGKDALVVAAMRASGDLITTAMERVFQSTTDIPTALEAISEFLAVEMEKSDYQKGCPIATVTLEEAAVNDALQTESQTIYDAWKAQITTFLIRVGCGEDQARSMALFSLVVIEGGLVLSRAERSTAPLKQATHMLIAYLESALES